MNKKLTENPLENLISDGGFCGIFRTIGCVGDSLSSGEFELLDENGNRSFHDMYDYSWGQCMARTIGTKAFNFSRGGMTAREFMNGFGNDIGCFNPENSCQGYIVALGVNDVSRVLEGNLEFGDISDIDLDDYTENKETLIGYYAAIIQKLRQQIKGARYFLVTVPRDGIDNKRNELYDRHAEFLYTLADMFDNTYVIDLRKFAPDYDEQFKQQFYLHGHMNACGYILTAKMFVTYIDYIIRKDTKSFETVPFVGTDLWEKAEKQKEYTNN